jgi:uroporphyrin-III C-methyltransferase
MTDDDKPDKKKTTHFHAFITFILAILVIALIAGFVITWKSLRTKQTDTLSATEVLQDQQKTQQATITQLQTALNAESKENLTQKQLIEDNQNMLHQMHAELNNNPSEWLITQTTHLLKLANMALYFEHNIPVTVDILKEADQRLYSTGNPALMPVRQLIAEDIASLEANPDIDIAGIYLRLQAIMLQAKRLPLIKLQFHQDADQSTQTKTASSGFKRALNEFTKGLNQLVVVRHNNHMVNPLLTETQASLLRETLQLQFNQAQWAVLHRQALIYQGAITNLASIIKQYYLTNAQSSAILAALDKLKQIEVKPALPVIHDALAALNSYQQQNLKHSTPVHKLSKKTLTSQSKTS